MSDGKPKKQGRRNFLRGAVGGALLSAAVKPSAVLAAEPENQAPNNSDASRYVKGGVKSGHVAA